ncbi:MAG: hypothetical protein [Circular genetic element sp.]|nr:MAG: hypothetical protein [Circular genetic element sp.]
MSRKTKINVLLPFKMVGELENYSRLGKRSSFIELAIRNRLDAKDDYNPSDIATRQLLAMMHHRANNNVERTLVDLLMELML